MTAVASLAETAWTTELTFAGGDADVTLMGTSAVKRFREQAGCVQELSVLRQIPPHPCVLHPEASDEVRGVIRFQRQPRDLMQALMSPEPLDERPCAQGILGALLHLQRICLVHRDVKPENILVTEQGTPMFCDFARALFAPAPLRISFSGTRTYAAPEALRGTCCLGNDVWSTGMVLFCLFERLFPFDEDDVPPRETWGPAVRPEVQYNEVVWLSPYASEVRQLVDAMLHADEQSRAPPAALRSFVERHRSALC